MEIWETLETLWRVVYEFWRASGASFSQYGGIGGNIVRTTLYLS